MAHEYNKHSYCLINGSFAPDDAKEVLLTLLDHKISFHQRRNVSLQERFYETDIAALQRIDELRQTKAEIKQLIENLAVDGMKLTINCNIDIVLEPERLPGELLKA